MYRYDLLAIFVENKGLNPPLKVGGESPTKGVSMAKLSDSELARQEHNVNTAWQNLQDDFDVEPDAFIAECADAIDLLQRKGYVRAPRVMAGAMTKLIHNKEQQTGETL